MSRRQEVKDLKAKLETYLKAFEKSQNVKISFGSISYDDNEMTSKITIVKEGVDLGRKEFERYCYKFGLGFNDYGAEVKLAGNQVGRICGIKPRSRQYPILVETAEGKKYKVSILSLRFTNAQREREWTEKSDHWSERLFERNAS